MHNTFQIKNRLKQRSFKVSRSFKKNFPEKSQRIKLNMEKISAFQYKASIMQTFDLRNKIKNVYFT